VLEHAAIQLRGAPVRIAPPLRGDRWLAANGPANGTHHRRSWLAHEGRAFFPERFAIDFVRLYAEGLTNGDPAGNGSYRGYGAEVIAVADAGVSAIKDGMADNVPANRAPSGMTLETMGGNLVVLDLGSGRYAFYAHLQPGSIRVKVGDRVRVGQVLGLLGNSGNSNAPHLHFQISDRPSLLLSEGVPFVIDSFVHEGTTRTDEIPLENWLVSFR
jgi:murein DD-endopeptidase MepM/ murein hydrolase activator NlpD